MREQVASKPTELQGAFKGERLAREADEIYQARLAGIPELQSLQAGETIDLEAFGSITLHTISALRDALLHLARQVEDPDLLGAVMLETLREHTATEPAD